MSSSPRLPVVLLWHMHQPQYRDALSGQYALPWTYLHAIKDYTDMAAHLEANPAARAVVNFTPVLIEQLEELAPPHRRAPAHGQRRCRIRCWRCSAPSRCRPTRSSASSCCRPACARSASR